MKLGCPEVGRHNEHCLLALVPHAPSICEVPFVCSQFAQTLSASASGAVAS